MRTQTTGGEASGWIRKTEMLAAGLLLLAAMSIAGCCWLSEPSPRRDTFTVDRTIDTPDAERGRRRLRRRRLVTTGFQCTLEGRHPGGQRHPRGGPDPLLHTRHRGEDHRRGRRASGRCRP